MMHMSSMVASDNYLVKSYGNQTQKSPFPFCRTSKYYTRTLRDLRLTLTINSDGSIGTLIGFDAADLLMIQW